MKNLSSHAEEMTTVDTPDTPAAQAGLRHLARTWGRTWVEINLAALERNFARLVQTLPPGGKWIVSAKKDAYGHGARALVGRLGTHRAFGALGLATIEEVIYLREQGVNAELLIFCVLAGEALEAAIRHGALLTITSLAEARAADAAAARLGATARAHFKLDTGMGRLGLLPSEVLADLPAILALSHLQIVGLYTHLPNAFADHAQGRDQLAALRAFQSAAGLGNAVLHIGGSDVLALGVGRETGLWLRTGIALYGDHPSLPDLEPVMSFKSRVIYRRGVPAGTAISYGGTFTTTRASELAIIGVGYGNGYLRPVSGHGAQVLIHGRRCPLLGRVCMDQIIVDVTDLSGETPVAVGDEAVLFGAQRWQGQTVLYPAAELAACAGTISYELFCLTGQINPRHYV
jgi:alanine racemase